VAAGWDGPADASRCAARELKKSKKTKKPRTDPDGSGETSGT
jgi:hypothetical protein